MLLKTIGLYTPNLADLTPFYTQVLELPVLSQDATRLDCQAGRSTLILHQSDEAAPGHYHFAFDVPENQFQPAVDWLQQRTPLAANREGRVLFMFSSWNSDSVYFKDPDGNILEFIARHNQPTAASVEFTARSLVAVSEVGLACPDVPAAVAALGEQLEASAYDGAGSDEFTAVGDENGLLIVVRQGRVWMPGTGKPAIMLPLRLEIENAGGRIFELSAPPYPFQVQP
jgi:catechol 2,3-dioxygenase-like lactoylglutathione lyase family enzyme